VKDPLLFSTSNHNRYHGLYHQSDFVLFQFLLRSSLISYRFLKENLSGYILTKLVGENCLCLNEGPALLQTKAGSLCKLNYYFSLLETHFPESHTIELSNNQGLKKKITTLYFTTKEYQLVKNAPSTSCFQELQSELKTVLILLSEQLFFFKENENVLFFLLSSLKEFRGYYDLPLITSILDRLGGIEKIEKYLIHGYAKRGFTHLLPEIHHQVHWYKELLWDY